MDDADAVSCEEDLVLLYQEF